MSTLAVRVLSGFTASLIFATGQAFADRWTSPSVANYYSPNHTFRLRITPADLGLGRGASTATLSERKFLFWYAERWTAPLSNRVAPVSALISDSGKYVVTFDNWHHVGYGDDVVVVYDGSNGRLLWKYRLEDILSPEEVCRVRCSVSSRWWASGKHAIDERGERLMLYSVSTKMVDLRTGLVRSVPAEQSGADKPHRVEGLESMTSMTLIPCPNCGKR